MTRPPVTLRVLHTCHGTNHVAVLTLTPVKLNSGGALYQGVRCDGTPIEVFDFDIDQEVP